jgi:hypothetical protein
VSENNRVAVKRELSTRGGSFADQCRLHRAGLAWSLPRLGPPQIPGAPPLFRCLAVFSQQPPWASSTWNAGFSSYSPPLQRFRVFCSKIRFFLG